MTTASFQLSTKTVELPSYEGSEVVVKKISVGVQREIQKKYGLSQKSEGDEKAIDASIDMVVQGIVSRNFVLDGEPVEVNYENVSQMPEEDISLLIFEILGVETPKYRKND